MLETIKTLEKKWKRSCKVCEDSYIGAEGFWERVEETHSGRDYIERGRKATEKEQGIAKAISLLQHFLEEGENK